MRLSLVSAMLMASCALVDGFAGSGSRACLQPTALRARLPVTRPAVHRPSAFMMSDGGPVASSPEPPMDKTMASAGSAMSDGGPVASSAEPPMDEAMASAGSGGTGGQMITAAEAEKIGNLVADDEYLGLSMELTELVRIAIREELKGKMRDFLGTEAYKLGDISKELDGRIKEEVAKIRGKSEYELGDLTVALDTFAKTEVTRMTGKDAYDFGDLSIELDKRVKVAVGVYTGKGSYSSGDLQAEVRKRVSSRVAEFTGKGEYSFGDVTREINRRRASWMQVRHYNNIPPLPPVLLRPDFIGTGICSLSSGTGICRAQK